MGNYAQSESNFFNSIQGVDVIKSYVKENQFSNSAQNIFANFQNLILNLTLFTNKISFWTQNIAVVLIVLVITVCSYGVFNNHITLGELVAILTFSSSLLASVGSLMGAYFTYQEAKVAYNRLYEFIEIEPEDIKGERSIPYIFNKLSIENRYFRYPGRPLILNNISINAELGDITMIKGKIGCRKSTLFNILMRFYSPEKG